MKIKIHKTITLPVVLYGCETWSVILREEYRLKKFKNRVLRSMFVPKRDEVTGYWRKLLNQEPHALYPSQIKEDEMSGACGMWHVWETREMCTGLWWGNLKERNHLEDLGVDGRIILR